MRRLVAAVVVALVLGACGGDDERRAVECSSDDPGEAATYSGDRVAFGAPAGEEVQSDRFGGPLPWFAKLGLFVRGSGTVVVRVPEAQHEVVKISGWGGRAGDLRTDVLLEAAPACASDWTAYPGGLVFSGRRCVRLRVEGPGDATGSAVLGLRRDC
jgi:hypothetical protein